jgi:hypothetical protein
MPATAMPVFEARNSYQYDGTNSADLAAAITDFTVVSETPTQLTFTSGGQNLTVVRGGYLVESGGSVAAADIFANADDFHDVYTEVRAATTHVHDILLHTGPGRAPGEDEYPDE